MNESTLVPREELSDLDWLARNVHEWPAGEHQPWCYVYMTYGGVMKAAGNFLDAVANPTMITIEQWLARRAELQNKPSWKDAPKWAEWLAQDEDGEWKWLAGLPGKYVDGWTAVKIKGCCKGLTLGDWHDTLEKRPEQAAFTPFTSIEDNQEQGMTKQQEMKQDNGWFERGDLPPVGVKCETLAEPELQWVSAEVVAHRDGFAIVWITSEKCGAQSDAPKHFRPIRTERDVLIEIIKETDDTDDKIADAILAAGFSLGRGQKQN